MTSNGSRVRIRPADLLQPQECARWKAIAFPTAGAPVTLMCGVLRIILPFLGCGARRRLGARDLRGGVQAELLDRELA
jgi:hypothetical protein